MSNESTMSFDFDVVENLLTITSPDLVIHVHATKDDLHRLAEVGQADWAQRQTLQVGTTLGHPVFWCRGEGDRSVNLMVGHDDETWSINLAVPASLVRSIAGAA